MIHVYETTYSGIVCLLKVHVSTRRVCIDVVEIDFDGLSCINCKSTAKKLDYYLTHKDVVLYRYVCKECETKLL